VAQPLESRRQDMLKKAMQVVGTAKLKNDETLYRRQGARDKHASKKLTG